jgi:ketosteroid isomerase-like protein
MSQENVELARRSCEAWLRGDIEGVFESFHPDGEWDTTHFEGWLESRVIAGRDEVRRFLLEEWLGAWDSYEAHVDDVLDAGGDQVVVLWRQQMTGRGSGAPVDLESAQVWTIRDGLILRIANYTDRGQAFAAVGLHPN